MRSLTCMSVLVMSSVFLNAQTLKKYDISNSGCSIHMFCQPARFDIELAQDSSTAYFARCTKNEVTYGIVCIKLHEVINNLNLAQTEMLSYVEYLKVEFQIITAKGYEKGFKLKDRADTRGVLDYWSDIRNNNWKMKAYTDGKFIAILYAFSRKEMPEELVNNYLEGFLLPGM